MNSRTPTTPAPQKTSLSKPSSAGFSLRPKTVVLVAATTGYQTRQFDAAAQKLDVRLILATDRCHILEDPWGDRAIPVRFEDPEASAQKIPPCDGIVAVADRPTLIAALAADRLSIPYHPFCAVSACHDKHESRSRFRAAGLPAPDSFLAHDASDGDRARYPCVLKPLGLSASRGVIRANNNAEFRAAFRRIQAILHRDDAPVQVETFIEGREFALEGVMTRGHLQVLAIFDKPDPLDGPFFEETIYVTPSRESEHVQNAIVQTTRTAVQALGLRDGPVHAEMRVNNRGAFMLEVAARPIGGLCAKALRFAGEMQPGRTAASTRARGRCFVFAARTHRFGSHDDPHSPRRNLCRCKRPFRSPRRSRNRGCNHHRESRPGNRAAAGRRQLSGIHLRARPPTRRCGSRPTRGARAACISKSSATLPVL